MNQPEFMTHFYFVSWFMLMPTNDVTPKQAVLHVSGYTESKAGLICISSVRIEGKRKFTKFGEWADPGQLISMGPP